MTVAEYESWHPRSRALFAADKVKANGLTPEEAERVALESFNRLLPHGLSSLDNFLFTAKDEQGLVLGFIWFNVRGSERNRSAFICDVIIEEPHRGQGHGRRMMTLIEDEIKKLGLQRVGLHVFGFNERAIHLYQSLGYFTTDLVMEKSIL